jgi:hypothetical protein
MKQMSLSVDSYLKKGTVHSCGCVWQMITSFSPHIDVNLYPTVWYLNFSEKFVKIILFEQEKIK